MLTTTSCSIATASGGSASASNFHFPQWPLSLSGHFIFDAVRHTFQVSVRDGWANSLQLLPALKYFANAFASWQQSPLAIPHNLIAAVRRARLHGVSCLHLVDPPNAEGASLRKAFQSQTNPNRSFGASKSRLRWLRVLDLNLLPAPISVRLLIAQPILKSLTSSHFQPPRHASSRYPDTRCSASCLRPAPDNLTVTIGLAPVAVDSLALIEGDQGKASHREGGVGSR